MPKYEKIPDEIRDYKQLLQKIPKDQRDIAIDLLRQIKFLDTGLDNMMDCINKTGWAGEFTNGNGKTSIRENPIIKGYNITLKSYMSAIDSLIDRIPGKAEEQDDELTKFFRTHKPVNDRP